MRAFKNEINGLRAIAVLAVLLFHAKVPLFRGGFVGVDIFFVISGNLMTSIVLFGLDRGDFSLLSFWAARARRIVPALLALCAVLAVLGWFLVDPITYREIGVQAAASLGFVSNIEFWRESGYFDQAAEAKWLLHTWSLSVEWQFYLGYPIVLLMARRVLGKRATTPLLWFGFLLSLELSGLVTPWRPSLAFYMLPTRAWEMIAGGLVLVHGSAIGPLSASGRRRLELAGLALIVLSLTIISPDTPWPSLWALLPVAGAAAVIFSDRKGDSLLNLPPVQSLGLCSYSVYLWHWPVIVAFRYYEWNASPWAAPAEISLGLALGALSTLLVERPSQAWLGRASFRRIIPVAIPALGAVLAWCAADYAHGGFVARSDHPALVADYISARSDWSFPEGACSRAGGDRSVNVCRLGSGENTLVIGDSHANQWFVRAADHKDDVTFMTRDGCPPLPGVHISPGADCPDFYRIAMTAAEEGHYKRIIFASFWQSYFRGPDAGLCVDYQGACVSPASRPEVVKTVFDGFARDLGKIRSGTEIVLVLPDLEPTSDLPVQLAKRAFFGRDASDLEKSTVTSVRAETNQTRMALETVARAVHAVTIDPLKTECGTTECLFIDGANRPLFRDSNHLRSSAVRAHFDFLDRYLSNAPLDEPAVRSPIGKEGELGFGSAQR